MKNNFCLLLLLSSLFYSCTQEEFTISETKDYTPISSRGNIISHTYYTLSYSNSDRQSEFAYYILTPESVNGSQSRIDDFRIDPKVTVNPVKSTDYQSSGYDRGHLCPAADMALNLTSMSETFFMSNMSPMAPSFNRGIWSRLETWVRETALSEGDLHIVTGPILNKSCGLISGSITVPCSFYKIVFKDGESPKAIGFILLNSGSTSSITNYGVTINEIESITGIDFFPQLDDNIENRIESTLDFNSWGL